MIFGDKSTRCDKLKNRKNTKLLSTLFILSQIILIIKSVPSVNADEEIASTGSCYRTSRRTLQGTCGRLVKTGVTKDRCCSGNYKKAWSYENQIINNNILVNNSVTNSCIPCSSSCLSTSCDDDQRCVMRSGMPRCVCSPKCHLEHKSTVCGSDSRTYSSECHLLKRACRKKKRVFVSHNGPCETCAGVNCRKEYRCVLDEQLYPKCKRCPKSCPISRKSRTICAVNGVTYRSSCYLKMASCQIGYVIASAYKGKCKGDATCRSVKCWKGERCLSDPVTEGPKCTSCSQLEDCLPASRPICASDGKTYHGWCALRHEACRSGYPLAAVPKHLCRGNLTDVPKLISNCLATLKASNERRIRKKNQRKIKYNSSDFKNLNSSSYHEHLISNGDDNYNQYNVTSKYEELTTKNTLSIKNGKRRKWKKKRIKECQHIISGRFLQNNHNFNP